MRDRFYYRQYEPKSERRSYFMGKMPFFWFLFLGFLLAVAEYIYYKKYVSYTESKNNKSMVMVKENSISDEELHLISDRIVEKMQKIEREKTLLIKKENSRDFKSLIVTLNEINSELQ